MRTLIRGWIVHPEDTLCKWGTTRTAYFSITCEAKSRLQQTKARLIQVYDHPWEREDVNKGPTEP
jgi:hypothetical protein